MEGEEPTQATQNVLDPRRVGKQNSGFSDEDISDILCVLYPHSSSARREVRRLALEDSPYIIGKEEADGVEPDYDVEDHASRFDLGTNDNGNYAIILRLSSPLKSPEAGFAFGRNQARCDVVFTFDELKRISNVHFRIYVNEYGNVMIEDQSTNGTYVDDNHLTSRPKDNKPPITRWVLSSGTVIKIFLHDQIRDLTFRVRIPRRDDEYDRAYTNKVEEYFARYGLQGRGPNDTIGPGPGGHVDLFRPPTIPLPRRPEVDTAVTQARASPTKKDAQRPLRREWNGSGKYNRVGNIGKGAFAVVYKVTSKYNGRPYAAKEIDKRKFIKNGVLDQKVENEMKIMQRIAHPNIVQYIENFDWDNQQLIIIMEYVGGGDLGKLIAEEGHFPEVKVQTMAKQLLSAMQYLHENNITHRDVKPDNILIQSLDPIDVKLTDFGLSKMVDTEQTMLRTFCGTLLYCAPEVYTEYGEYDEGGIRSRQKNKRRAPRYDHAVDIWSLGGVLFYTLCGSPPYPARTGIGISELLHNIMTTRLNVTPLQLAGVSDFGVDFIQRMLQNRPEKRATILELDTHPWLGGSGSTIQASQSYDEITDEEDADIHPSQFGQPGYEDDRVSDSMGEESEKENYTFTRAAQGPRLFGEVGSSALGSSGAIPSDMLNLAGPMVMDSQMDEAYGSDESTDSQENNRRTYRQTTASIAQNQSEDQLDSLVFDVASQSLGGADTAKASALSPHQSRSFFTSSKRKPPSLETSDEHDENTPPEKPTIKRLRSEGNVVDLADDVLEEYKLLARLPPIRRLGSGRQIDGPYSKVQFWEQDRRTWHLKYPEMTQLQYDAFCQGAREGGEEFGPGKTRLWELAMKHFPPRIESEVQQSEMQNTRIAGLKRDDRKIETIEFPPTAAPFDAESIPDTAPPESQLIVPVQEDTTMSRLVGMVESSPSSCVQGISFPITDSLVSFGRGLENTQVFEPRTESRIPKYAFKILLFKEGYDPAKDPAKAPHPWMSESIDDEDSYSFWISTKATIGIKINGYVLPSVDAKNPHTPSQNWTKIHEGDELIIWGTAEGGSHTKLVFRCLWGGSSHPRGPSKPLELASASLSQKLDNACQRTEQRIERQKKVAEAKRDHEERKARVDAERERSTVFEERRAAAVEVLQARQGMMHASRRGSGSPMSAPATAATTQQQMGRMLPPPI